MKINRESFLRALESVKPGLALHGREMVEQSNCFVFQGGNVHTFNDEVACSIPSGLDKEFAGAVRANSFLAVLAKFPEEEVGIDVAENELLVIGKRRKAGITMEQEIALPISNVEKPKKWASLPEDFADAIAMTHLCTSVDESKFSITCVHIHPKWVEACSYFQVCRWKMKTGFSQPLLIRGSSIGHISQLGMTEFSETDHWIHFQNGHGLVLSCRRYEGENFPDIAPFLNADGKAITLPKGLVEAAEKAEIFSAENNGSNMIQVELKPGRLKVKGQGINGWYSEISKLAYDGDIMNFFIPPQILKDLVKKHNDYSISPTSLKVNGGKYTYAAALIKPEEAGNVSTEDTEESEGEGE